MARAVDTDETLPGVIPIFPLNGVLLLPGGELPLNIFEPRYLAMVRDAMANDAVIGMVQLKSDRGGPEPEIYSVGCAGRISNFSETDDGRILISLAGVARFRVAEELARTTAYRQVKADYAPYERDLAPAQHLDAARRAALMEGLRRFLDRRGLTAEWGTLLSVPDQVLVNALAMISPFSPADKQALLEADTLDDRARAMILLMDFALAGDEGDEGAPQKPN